MVLPSPGNFFENSGSLFGSSGVSCETYRKRLTAVQGGGAVETFWENHGLPGVYTEVYFPGVLSSAAPDPEEGVFRLQTKYHMEPGQPRLPPFDYTFGVSLAGVSIRMVQVVPVVTGRSRRSS